MSDPLTHLWRTPLFNELSPEDVVKLKSVSEAVTLAAGETLCSQGDAIDCAYILASGTVVEVVFDGQFEHDQAGEILLPSALLSPYDAEQTLVASTASELLKLPRVGFEALLAQREPVALSLLHEVARHLVSLVRALNRTMSDLVKRKN